MARKRMVHIGIWESKQFSKISDRAKITYLGLITLGDFAGRFKADPALIRAKVWPRSDHKIKEIEEWLQEIYDTGDEGHPPLVVPYEVKGELYALHPNWQNYQNLRPDREKVECPDPSKEIMKKYNHETAPQNCGETAAQAKLSEVKLSKDKLSEAKLPEFQKTLKKILIESEICDEGYADKTVEQVARCKKEDFETIKRKTAIMVNCLKSNDEEKRKKANTIFHEIAGLVNDSQMQKLSNQ